jgi:hypothetical protein
MVPDESNKVNVTVGAGGRNGYVLLPTESMRIVSLTKAKSKEEVVVRFLQSTGGHVFNNSC